MILSHGILESLWLFNTGELRNIEILDKSGKWLNDFPFETHDVVYVYLIIEHKIYSFSLDKLPIRVSSWNRAESLSIKDALEEILMEKVRICDTLIHSINVACISKVPTADSPEIDEWIPAQLLQVPSITGPVPILELFLNEEPDALLDFLILLHHGHKGLIC
jgi:hypothetical protein